ncbi:MAG TPA: (Fe-S)-binding protein [Cytophagaceae bacterium]
MRKNIVVDIFIPCFVDQVYPNTGMNMVKVLESLGCEVNYIPTQTCCGQPAFNAGFFDEAKDVAVKFVNEFAKNNRYIVAPSASCVGMIRNNYIRLFENSSYLYEYRKVQRNIYEFTEFLVDVLKVTRIEGAELDAVATYHDSCSALRECLIKTGPRQLLKNVRGLKLVEMKDCETCCGFGGTFAVKFEPISVGMAEQKIDNALAAEAEIIISTDSSCLMHLQGYTEKQNKKVKLMHIADVLASGW